MFSSITFNTTKNSFKSSKRRGSEKVKKRSEYEKTIRIEFEIKLKNKYKFKFEEDNFKEALKNSLQKKEKQNLEMKNK